MQAKQLLLISSLCLSGLFSGSLIAKDGDHDGHDHDHEMEQHGSHEHGVARMTVAVTDSGVEVTLDTPAANIFGFEHTANSDEEQHIVHEAVLALRAGNALFMADQDAECQMEKYVMASDIVTQHVKAEHGGKGLDEDGHYLYEGSGDKAEHDHDGHEHAEKDEHDHDHEHAEKDEHDHDHEHAEKDEHDHSHEHAEKGEHDHDHEHAETHSDITATWTFGCARPAAITELETRLFSAFPQGFERINVEWITADAAGATELEADDTIKLSQ